MIACLPKGLSPCSILCLHPFSVSGVQAGLGQNTWSEKEFFPMIEDMVFPSRQASWMSINRPNSLLGFLVPQECGVSAAA